MNDQLGAQLLPPMARAALQRAAKTSNAIDPLARTKEIERVTAWCRAMWPECFKEDGDGDK